MKKSYFSLCFLLFIGSLNAQIITFSDAVFKAKLLESSPSNFVARDLNGDYFSIDSNSNGEIEITEALQVGFLQIDNASITSLNEISNFTNLIELDCENNLLTTLNVSALSSLTLLNCSNNQLISLNISGLTELQNLNCQFNQLSNLNVNDITNLANLNCSYNQIASLNLSNLFNLTVLTCNDNALTSFDVSDLINVTDFDCSNNQLTSINTSALVSLVTLNCTSNLLASLTIGNLVNFTTLNCSSNHLTALSLINLAALTDLNCDYNQLSLINLNDLIALKNFTCTNNQLSSLNLNGLTQLENINCANNVIATIDLTGLNHLITLNCNSNHLSSLDVSNVTTLKYLYCNLNAITVLNVNGLNLLQVLSCSNNQIPILNLNSTIALQSLYCSANHLSTLNLSSLFNFQNLFCSNNELTSLFIKNGSFEGNLQFSGNPNLEFICADEAETDYVQDEINNNNYTNCHVNSYCSFTPGGVSYTLQGSTKFDSNANGCDALDVAFPNLQLSFSDGIVTENLVVNSSGNYSKSLTSGSYTVAPWLENSNYFSVSPSTTTVEFPQFGTPFLQNFCITANGSHSDIEIAMIPIANAIPGQNATYKILYKNKGTIPQSGTVTLNFNDTFLDFVSSNPANTTQTINLLNWSFATLNPLETRAILVTLQVNSTSNTFPVTVGQVLPFTASVATSNTDETPNNNSINFNQTVKGTSSTTDKVCIEGTIVSTNQVGQYVHYCIHFKNTGTSTAQNIVVKDIIDTTKYDFTTLVPLDGSHSFETRLTNGNTAEFIFKNINLGFGSTNSEGYVLFKIKTLPTLTVGETFSNTASVYFDYKAPLATNIESTTIQTLENESSEYSNHFRLYPNPVKEVLTIHSENGYTVDGFSIYNSLGQMIQTIVNPTNLSVDVSPLRTGIYFININTDNRSTTIKFIKE